MNKTISLAFASLCAALLLVPSCKREDRFAGKSIRFNVSTVYGNGPDSRTEYSGKDQSDNTISSSSEAERIDWLPTDMIRILCEQAAGVAADYAVTPGSTSGRTHYATIAPVDEGLEWTEDLTYQFYAFYPSPVQDDDAAIAAKAGGKATVGGTIPSSQNPTALSGRVFKPDMDYAYMYANTTAGMGENINLEFHPLVTTLEFTLLTKPGDEITSKLTSVKLSSTQTGAFLSGDFTAELTSGGLTPVAATDVTGGSNEITVDLTGVATGGVQLSSDPAEAYTVTFLTLPTDQTELTLTLYFADATKRTLALKDNGSWITVAACKKAYIWRLGAPKTMDTYTLGTLSQVTTSYYGGTRTMSSSFASYKTKSNGTKIAVPFTLEFAVRNGTWRTTPPSWISMNAIDLNGSITGQAVEITASAQVNSTPDPHRTAMIMKGYYETAKDLSTINVASGTTVARSTANCYVVDRPGNYKFPLVYGNAIKNGIMNQEAFRAKAGASATNFRPDNGSTFFLGRYKDHLNQNIMSPYITAQHTGKAMRAVLLWQDIPGLVSVDSAISGSGNDACITFNVPEDNLTQGNALIALLVDDNSDGTPETIAWSWHIWVTEENLANAKSGPSDYLFAPVNIGWCEERTETFAERYCYVRVKQEESGLSTFGVMYQSQGSRYFLGNNPFFEWGRKDPLPASNGYDDLSLVEDKPCYPSSADYTPRDSDGPVSIGAAIQHPFLHYSQNSIYDDWCNTTYLNTWNSVRQGNGTSLLPSVKSIYDPSPVGYKVPNAVTWSGLTWSNVGRNNGYKHTDSGLFFPSVGYRQPGYNLVGGTLYLEADVYDDVDFNEYDLVKAFRGDTFYTFRAFAGSVRPVKEPEDSNNGLNMNTETNGH